MHAFRSPFRLFLIGVAGLVLILAAIDIMFLHEISTPPDGAPGPLNTRGQAEQRGDIIWGAALIGMGVILLGWSFTELVRRKPVVDVRDDGLYAQIGATMPDVLIPWSAVQEVRSGVHEDSFDGSIREELIVTIRDASHIPDELTGAAWVGNDLHIDAHDWNRAVTDIALAAQGARNYAVRPSAAAAVDDEPAMMWETTVDTTTEVEESSNKVDEEVREGAGDPLDDAPEETP